MYPVSTFAAFMLFSFGDDWNTCVFPRKNQFILTSLLISLRVAKRWAASHLFSACLVEEAVELLVAYLFLKPLPFNVPCSRVTGFLRLSSVLLLKIVFCWEYIQFGQQGLLQWSACSLFLFSISWKSITVP